MEFKKRKRKKSSKFLQCTKRRSLRLYTHIERGGEEETGERKRSFLFCLTTEGIKCDSHT